MCEYKYHRRVCTDVKLVKKSVKATMLGTKWKQPCSVGQILSQVNFTGPGSEQDGSTKHSPAWSKVTARSRTNLWWFMFQWWRQWHTQGQDPRLSSGRSCQSSRMRSFPWESCHLVDLWRHMTTTILVLSYRTHSSPHPRIRPAAFMPIVLTESAP